MDHKRALQLLFATTLFGCLLGGLIGFLLGTFVPDGYRMFEPGNSAYNPVAIGLGLGVSQGAMLGLVAGIAILIADALRRRP